MGRKERGTHIPHCLHTLNKMKLWSTGEQQRLSSRHRARGRWSPQSHGEMSPYSICTPFSIPPVALSNLFNQGQGWSHASLGDVPQQAEQNSSGGAISKNWCCHSIRLSRERNHNSYVPPPRQILAKQMFSFFFILLTFCILTPLLSDT